MTVKDLNLTEEQAEQACFLLNYRSPVVLNDARHWGRPNLHEFSVDELKASLAYDDTLTAEHAHLKKTGYGERIQSELRTILEAA
jgi:hypothetical protein